MTSNTSNDVPLSKKTAEKLEKQHAEKTKELKAAFERMMEAKAKAEHEGKVRRTMTVCMQKM